MSQSLLIVEDEASIREPLVKYFGNNQFRVKAASNAAEARALLAGHAFDLVIADIMMPGEDGLSLCRHIRSTSTYVIHTFQNSVYKPMTYRHSHFPLPAGRVAPLGTGWGAGLGVHWR